MADSVAIPAELTDTLRSLSTAFGPLMAMVEEIVPALSAVFPVVGTFVEALEASQPEILAVVEAVKFAAPVIQQLAGWLGSQLEPALQELSASVSSVLTPILNDLEQTLESVLTPIVEALALVFKRLSLILDVVAVALNPLAAVSDALKKAFAAVSHAVGAMVSALGHAGAAVLAGLGKMASGLASMAGGVYSAFKAGIVDPLAGAVRTLASTLGGAAGHFASASFGSIGGMSGTSDILKKLAGGINVFTGSLTGGVAAIAGAVTPFVQALNPNFVYGLNYAFRGLQATIGVALTPVVQALSNGIRQMAAALMPAMKPLGEVFGKLASVVMRFAVNSMQRFAESLQEMMPAFKLIADGIEALSAPFAAVRAVVFAFVDSFVNKIKGMFGGADSKDMLSMFKDALHKATEGIVRFAAMVARFFGFGDFVDNLKNQLTKFSEPVKGSGAAPAPSEVGFKSFEDIQKTMSTAAFAAMGAAGGGAEDKSEREWLQNLAKSLDEMKDGKTIQGYINDAKAAVTEAITGAQNWITTELQKKYDEIEEEAAKKLRHWWAKAKDYAGNEVNRVIAPVKELAHAFTLGIFR